MKNILVENKTCLQCVFGIKNDNNSSEYVARDFFPTPPQKQALVLHTGSMQRIVMFSARFHCHLLESARWNLEINASSQLLPLYFCPPAIYLVKQGRPTGSGRPGADAVHDGG